MMETLMIKNISLKINKGLQYLLDKSLKLWQLLQRPRSLTPTGSGNLEGLFYLLLLY